MIVIQLQFHFLNKLKMNCQYYLLSVCVLNYFSVCAFACQMTLFDPPTAPPPVLQFLFAPCYPGPTAGRAGGALSAMRRPPADGRRPAPRCLRHPGAVPHRV